MEIRLKSRESEDLSSGRCPYCLDLVESLEAVLCDNCETVHHAICFRSHGQCTVLGCGGRAREPALSLDSNAIAQIHERLSKAPETAVLAELERLARSGVPEPALAETFRPYLNPRIELALLALRARSGRGDAAQELLQALRTSQGALRLDALKLLAGLPRLPQGTVPAVLEVFRDGHGKARCELLFKRFGESEISELLEHLLQSEVNPNLGFEALRWTFSSCRGPQRSARMELLRRLTGRHKDPLASALFSAAVLTDALAEPTASIEAPNENYGRHLETALWLGLPITLLSFGAALAIPDELGLLWFASRLVAAAFLLSVLALKALESSESMLRQRKKEAERKKRGLLEWRLKQVLEGREFSSALEPPGAKATYASSGADAAKRSRPEEPVSKAEPQQRS